MRKLSLVSAKKTLYSLDGQLVVILQAGWQQIIRLAQYKGPLKLIRRLQEEILITDETGTEVQRRASNRANVLLKRILQQRHPSLIADLDSQVRKVSVLFSST
ncbi:hypothetical protein ANCDUO_25782 [Ancylostoma duodenale]|uniref:Uncharacterized protein n=1 Tax=Ancylostoma duodenale TaxID=51022 RepID=A0A0C2F6P8_9BILA|nr:hypothetical protein ANCDUO_25782 [Ancylostoma duodenale]